MLFFKSLIAGAMIAIGGVVYLMSPARLAGAFLFSMGLFTVVSFDLNLYTGRIGYLVGRPTAAYGKELAVTLLGNLSGAVLVGLLVRLTRLDVATPALALVQTKLGDTPLSILILSFFCGVLMFFGVDGYKTCSDGVGRHLAIVFAVMVFILSGFEHCVANMFYLTAANAWSLRSVGYMLLMILGNSLGSMAVALVVQASRRARAA